jgi:hypothetical protein
MSELVIFRDLGITIKVSIPKGDGSSEELEAKWMRNIIGSVFEIGFGITNWLASIQEGIITPLSCAIYFTEQETKFIDLSRRLNMKYSETLEQIYKQRAGEYNGRKE